MKRVLLSLLLLSWILTAQSGVTKARLMETIRALSSHGASSVSLSAQLVDEMKAVAPADRQPSRGALAGFANAFAGALIGKDLAEPRVATFETCIAAILSGSGTNLQPAKLLRDTLTAAGVASSRIPNLITLFIAVGEEVRGPDDTPVGARFKSKLLK